MTNFSKSICKISVFVCLAIIAAGLIDMRARAQSQDRAATPPAVNQLARDIFKQLIEINTTDSVGNVTTAAEAMAQLFRDAGFPESDMQILGPNERKKNLVL